MITSFFSSSCRGGQGEIRPIRVTTRVDPGGDMILADHPCSRGGRGRGRSTWQADASALPGGRACRAGLPGGPGGRGTWQAEGSMAPGGLSVLAGHGLGSYAAAGQ